MKLLTHYLSALQQSFPPIVNWRENSMNDSLFYSFRDTLYTRETYPSRLHYHDYYELVIVSQGDIQYLCEGESYHPQRGDIILIPPRKMHMSMIAKDETRYIRHVFYLYPDAFDAMGCSALAAFLSAGDCFHAALEKENTEKLLSLLSQLEQALQKQADALETALARGLTLQIFYLLNTGRLQYPPKEGYLPENMRNIQRYLDENYGTITSVSQVAEHFFYSREYLSRLFRQYFNTTVSDYLMKRRIACSQQLISQGTSLTDACFQAGFSSMSSFIRSFHALTGLSPSAYRKMLQENGK